MLQSTTSENPTKLYLEVDSGWNRKKLSEYLFEHVRGLSKMYLRELIRDGKCEVNGIHENAGYRLRTNDLVELEADMSRGTAMRPQNISLTVVYEDEYIIVVDKPAGMLVHPTHRDKNGTLLNALSFYLNGMGNGHEVTSGDQVENLPFIRPSLPHRLDKETSGLIVAAKSVRTHRRLYVDFKEKRVRKRYLALVEGRVVDDSGEIDLPVGRYAEKKSWDVKHDGKEALSRIHCASIGHPILGDVARGGRQAERLYLHAFELSFSHPVTGEPVHFGSQQTFPTPANE
jgi:23S rRNA pseudouridine1911/1915/1917 synthase